MRTIAFAQAAHEFRNPLNGIIQSLDLLQEQIAMNDNEKGKKESGMIGFKYFNIARSCSKLMLFLVNDILDFAQFESSKVVLNLNVKIHV